MSDAKILDEFGAPEPSKRRKWCLVLPLAWHIGHEGAPWQATAWFATKRAATDYGIKHHRREGFAVGRMEWLGGFTV